jgi:hypothetical protein
VTLYGPPSTTGPINDPTRCPRRFLGRSKIRGRPWPSRFAAPPETWFPLGYDGSDIEELITQSELGRY